MCLFLSIPSCRQLVKVAKRLLYDYEEEIIYMLINRSRSEGILLLIGVWHDG